MKDYWYTDGITTGVLYPPPIVHPPLPPPPPKPDPDKMTDDEWVKWFSEVEWSLEDVYGVDNVEMEVQILARLKKAYDRGYVDGVYYASDDYVPE